MWEGCKGCLVKQNVDVLVIMQAVIAEFDKQIGFRSDWKHEDYPLILEGVGGNGRGGRAAASINFCIATVKNLLKVR